MIRASLCALVSVVGVLAGPGIAGASVVIDFESAPVGTFLSYTESGVTFTATDGQLIQAPFGPNGTRALLGVDSNPYSTIRADISGGATSVAIDLGDFNADPDTIFLEIYDSSNTLIGSTSAFLDASFTGMQTLSLSGSGIAYAIFGSTDPSLNGSSIYADNFAFEPAVASSVPEPSTLALAGLAGLGGLVAVARRRKSDAA